MDRQAIARGAAFYERRYTFTRCFRTGRLARPPIEDFMLVKLVQKRVLAALADGRVRLAADIRAETECSGGELLELSSCGLVLALESADALRLRISPSGRELISRSRADPGEVRR